MVENLKVLYGSHGENITADMEDVRQALSALNPEQVVETPDPVQLAGDFGPGLEQLTSESMYKVQEAIVFQAEGKLVLGIIEEVHPGLVWVSPLENVYRTRSMTNDYWSLLEIPREG